MRSERTRFFPTAASPPAASTTLRWLSGSWHNATTWRFKMKGHGPFQAYPFLPHRLRRSLLLLWHSVLSPEQPNFSPSTSRRPLPSQDGRALKFPPQKILVENREFQSNKSTKCLQHQDKSAPPRQPPPAQLSSSLAFRPVDLGLRP